MSGVRPLTPRDHLFGVGFDRVDMGEAVSLLQGRDPAEQFAVVTTPNVDVVLQSDANPALRRLLEQSWLCLNDSRILRAGARRIGRDLTLVPGSSLTERLFEEVIRPDEPITVIGCTEATIDRLKARYGLTAVAHHWPPFGFLERPAELAACVDFVRRHPSRFVFLALGFPRQETVADAIIRAGGATGIGICVGASLNFLGGETKRAPLWMQNLSLEWLHRLASEPRRLWRRYLLGAYPFVRLLQREKAASRGRSASISSSVGR